MDEKNLDNDIQNNSDSNIINEETIKTADSVCGNDEQPSGDSRQVIKNNSKKTGLIATLAIVAVVVLACITFFAFKFAGKLLGGSTNAGKAIPDIQENQYTPVTVSAKDELRGVWVASVSNINFPSMKSVPIFS